MILDFNGTVTDFIGAIKEIMTIPNLSDFASEEKAKARLNDYTNPFVRMLLLAMPAFLADSEVLLNAVNKEYFDKLFVFVLSWEAAKLFFQKESENEAVLEELSKLMQMTARDLLLALEKEGEEKKLNELMAALIREQAQRMLEEELRIKIVSYEAMFFILSTNREQLERLSEEHKEEAIDKIGDMLENTEFDAILTKAGIEPDSEKGREVKRCIQEEIFECIEKEAARKQQLMDAGMGDKTKVGYEPVTDKIRLRPRFLDFGTVGNHNETRRREQDLLSAIQKGLSKVGVDKETIDKVSDKTMDQVVNKMVSSDEHAAARDLAAAHVEVKLEIEEIKKAEAKLMQDCVQDVGEKGAQVIRQAADAQKEKLAARRASRGISKISPQ